MSARGVSVGALLTTSDADIYVVPANFKADIEKLIISNNSALAVNVTVKWYDAAKVATFTLLENRSVPANNSIELDNVLLLNASDKIIASAATGSVIRFSVRSQETYTQVKLT